MISKSKAAEQSNLEKIEAANPEQLSSLELQKLNRGLRQRLKSLNREIDAVLSKKINRTMPAKKPQSEGEELKAQVEQAMSYKQRLAKQLQYLQKQANHNIIERLEQTESKVAAVKEKLNALRSELKDKEKQLKKMNKAETEESMKGEVDLGKNIMEKIAVERKKKEQLAGQIKEVKAKVEDKRSARLEKQSVVVNMKAMTEELKVADRFKQLSQQIQTALTHKETLVSNLQSKIKLEEREIKRLRQRVKQVNEANQLQTQPEERVWRNMSALE